ncbi:MAG: transposase [Acidimicrobiales bacterium]
MVDTGSFPPEVVVAVNSLACELPSRLGVPLSRLYVPDIRQAVIEQGIVAEISGATISRELSQDAISPWRHRSWIFPRDPNFETKVARVLDLYAGEWEGKPLRADDFVVSSDFHPGPRAMSRELARFPRTDQARRVRVRARRALQYLAAWDVHRAKVFGRCEPATGIEPFGRLVEQVMTTEPYASARRVFWVVDNGSSHRGDVACERLTKRWSNAQLVHVPV